MDQIKEEIMQKIPNIDSIQDLNNLKVEYMGKKGIITELSSKMKDIPNEEKREYGMKVNAIRDLFNSEYAKQLEYLENKEISLKLESEAIDISLDGTKLSCGSTHPLNRVSDQMQELFVSMGYDVVEGPEIEYDKYNFSMLNLPDGHPARDAQDSFYIKDMEVLLRTQTSAVQARHMEAQVDKKPIRVICPGKTYRRDDDDPTHSHQFSQLEGLVVDKNITLGDLKGTLEVFAKKMFAEDSKVRFRPSYFPFTEPSLEVDISCFKCKGTGCSICKNTGWIEILGAGMVHPNVLTMGGYDPKIYTGFAFGIGIERVAMLKYGINDIRTFYINDLRFLDNFNRVDGGDIDETK